MYLYFLFSKSHFSMKKGIIAMSMLGLLIVSGCSWGQSTEEATTTEGAAPAATTAPATAPAAETK
jgi:hypothetical protein